MCRQNYYTYCNVRVLGTGRRYLSISILKIREKFWRFSFSRPAVDSRDVRGLARILFMRIFFLFLCAETNNIQCARRRRPVFCWTWPNRVVRKRRYILYFIIYYNNILLSLFAGREGLSLVVSFVRQTLFAVCTRSGVAKTRADACRRRHLQMSWRHLVANNILCIYTAKSISE